MKIAAATLLFSGLLAGQTATVTPVANPLVETSKGMFAIAKNDVLKSAEKIPADLWSYRPTPEVRTIGELFAHIADGQYEFCGVAAEGKSVTKDVEKNAKSKEEIVTAVKTAFAYCDAAYAKMNDKSSAELVSFFGRKMSRLGVMDFNFGHTMEHYGNLVTYMRMKSIVPPSSQGQ